MIGDELRLGRCPGATDPVDTGYAEGVVNHSPGLAREWLPWAGWFFDAAVTVERVGAHHFLDERTPPFLGGSRSPTGHAQIPCRGVNPATLSGGEGRGSGGSCPHSRPSGAYNHGCGLGERAQAHLFVVDKGGPRRAQGFSMAIRIWSFLSRSVAEQSGMRVHHRTRRASPNGQLPGRVPQLTSESRGQLRRKPCLGLSDMRKRSGLPSRGSRDAVTPGYGAQRLWRSGCQLTNE